MGEELNYSREAVQIIPHGRQPSLYAPASSSLPENPHFVLRWRALWGTVRGPHIRDAGHRGCSACCLP